MRIDSLTEAGQALIAANRVDVWLDGKPMKLCVVVDSDQGFVVRLSMGEGGFLLPEGIGIKTQKDWGVVKIVLTPINAIGRPQ